MPDGCLRVPHVDAALFMIRNFTLSRHPLYGVGEWLQRFDPSLPEVEPSQLDLLNDDRLDRTLDELFQIDRRTLTTRLVVHTVKAFDIDLGQLHNDSTTITFTRVNRTGTTASTLVTRVGRAPRDHLGTR